MANNNNDLRDVVLNTSVVLEGIFRARKTTIDEKIDLAIERMSETTIALLKLKKALNDNRDQK